MTLKFAPARGQILICDYSTGFLPPEMGKRRPVLVISPKFKRRWGLVTVVPFSTTAPAPPQPYHCQIDLDPPLPAPYQERLQWVKADMIATVGFHRLRPPFDGKVAGARTYDNRILDDEQFQSVMACVKVALDIA